MNDTSLSLTTPALLFPALLVLSLVVACFEILVSIHALNIHLAGIRPPPER